MESKDSIDLILSDYGSDRASSYRKYGDGPIYSDEAEKLKAQARSRLEALMLKERIDELNKARDGQVSLYYHSERLKQLTQASRKG